MSQPDGLARLANIIGSCLGHLYRFGSYLSQIGTKRIKNLAIICIAVMAGGYILLLVAGAFGSKPAKQVEESTLDTQEQLQWRLDKIDRLQLSEPVESLLDREQDSRSAPTLRLLVLLHRHGDRTPNEFEPGNPLAEEPFWTHHGLGALTNKGKARMYLLGELIRARYASFLGDSFNKLEVVSRSSGLERCIESGQMFSAGLMRRTFSKLNKSSNRSSWGPEGTLGSMWEPVATQTLEKKFDGMLSSMATCRLAGGKVESMDKSAQLKAIQQDYRAELQKIPQQVKTMRMLYQWALIDDRVSTETEYFSDKVSAELLDVRERVAEATSLAYMTLARGNATVRRLKGGLLADEILRQMESTCDSYPTRPVKLVHLSTQDAQLSLLLGVLDVWDQDERVRSRPGYGSTLVFELHKDQDWFVKTVYYNGVPSEALELRLACDRDGRGCRLGEFKELFTPVRLTGGWLQWMKECGNDLTRLDPYGYH